jgi:hypothetical protein
MAEKTMLFGECGGVLLCVHNSEPPRPDEWDAYVEYCVRLPTTCNKTLVVTEGGGPDAAQRRALHERYLAKQKAENKEYLVAVMTDSALVRGIVKALNWFNPDANSFPYNEGTGVPLAIRHLRLDDRTGARIRIEIEVLRRELARLSAAALEPHSARAKRAS